MQSSETFFATHITQIIAGVMILISLLVIFSLLGVNFSDVNDSPNIKTNKVITIEAFNSDDPAAFCNTGKLSDRNKTCKELSKENCKLVDCCGLLTTENGEEKCVGGHKHGPTYKSFNGEKIFVKRWEY